jgi:thiamine pyrophosphate-dependent acetolactate synthase large subunit-like protein
VDGIKIIQGFYFKPEYKEEVMSEEKKTDVTRRTFLKTAAVGAVAAAAVTAGTAPFASKAQAESVGPDPGIKLAPEFQASRVAALPVKEFPMTGADVFGMCCKAEGLAAFIHCPGNYDIQHAIAEQGIPSYSGRHDGAMGHACDAFYRVTGEIAAFNAQYGGCVALGLSPFLIAEGACSPILICSGNGATKDEDSGRAKGTFGGAGRDEYMTKGVTKWGKTITTPARIWEHTAEAFRQMRSGVPKPVHLVWPTDVCTAKFRATSELQYYFDKALHSTETQPYPDPKAITAAIALLKRAERPMIVAAQGVFRSKAWDILAKFAEKTNIPVTETGPQRGKFSDGHPLCASAAPDCYPSVDVVLIVGQYKMPQIGGWAFGPKTKYIRIHLVQEEIGRDLPIEVGIVSDEKAALEALYEEAPSMKHDSWIAEVKAAGKKFEDERAALYAKCINYNGTNMVHPASIGKAIGDFLYNGKIPRDQTTVVSGGFGIARYARNYLRAYRPGQILNGPYWEIVVGPDIAYSVGVGVAMELGAGPQAAYKGSPFLCVTGDAGFGITGMEIETLAKYRMPAIIVVYNNNTWGTWASHHPPIGSGQRIRKEYLHLFQENLRYDKMSQALGGYGEYVQKAEEVLPALERAYQVAVTKRLPSVINIQGKKEFWDVKTFPPGQLGKIEPGFGAYYY